MHSGDRTNLILIDANRDYAETVRQALDEERYGYAVTCAHDLGTALEQLAGGSYDSVLLDPALPGSNPLDVISEIRGAVPDVPIVVVTDSRDDRFFTRVMRHGAQDFLAKPQADHDTVARAVRHALERKYAGQALRESEERFRRVFEEGPVGMALIGRDMKLVRVNAAFCSMLGYDQGDLIGLHLDRLMCQDDPREVEHIERTFRGDIPHYQAERRLLRKNGSEVWGLLTASVVRDGGGEPLYGIAMVEDITERRRAEDAVRESHSLLHAVIGGTTDGVYVKDSKGRYLLLNEPAAQILGAPAAEVVGKSDAELLPPEVAEHISESDRKVLKGGETRTFEERIALGDEPRTYLTTKGVYHDESDFVVGLFGIARDITDRKRAEEELRRSESNYRTLVDHAIYGIYRSSPDGRFLAVNPALVSMLGYDSQEELLSINIRELYSDPAERDRLVKLYKRSKRIEGLDVEWQRRDGRRIMVRLSGRPVRSEESGLEGFEMIVEDVTERRLLEAQLRQAQKMEAVGELTGGIAHDLNNVLTIVSANLDLVVDSLPSEQAGLRDDLAETRRAARRGRALIKKLLGFSRRSKLEVKPIDPGQLTADVLGMLRRIVPETIRVDLTVEGAGMVIDADHSAIEQVLINLATNARDAMPNGGDIKIHVSRHRLDESYRLAHPWAKLEECVRVSVSDTGEGMDAQTLQRIFEPFFTTKPHGVGTGLGMSMVYGLVKQHRGFVDVESEPGKGTTVNLLFPVSEDPVPQFVAEEAVEVRSGGSETILLVEDEVPIQRAARRVLEKHGYEVLLADNGEDALEAYRSQRDRIDLVVSDVVMPKLSGAQLYEALRRDGEEPKFLFMSGYSARDVTDSQVLDSSLPFLHKPWSVGELLQKVREVLDSRG
jgi:PAS domain S-box-containing protein